jgi:glycosyltransferase involved in cell wall biosynthesis
MAKQPRLVYITTAAFPARKASAVQVMQMCAALAEAGALVKLVSRQIDPAEDVFAHYGLAPTFSVEPRPFPRAPRPTDIFQLQAALAETGRDWVCYSRGQDLVAPVVALGRGGRALVEAHGRPVTLRQRVLLQWIARHSRGRLIVISEPLREFYRRELGVDSMVAPDAVDLKRFEPPLTSREAQARLGLGPGPWLVYVGGLYAGRGLETLFAATAGQPVKVLVVGGHDAVEVAAWRAKAAALGAQVQFEGYQPPARVPLYLFAADGLVMPYGRRIYTGSGEDITHWTSPLKLYEYLAAGRPIVSTAVPAVRGVLAHGDNALLAQPEDAASLWEMIARALAEPELARALARNARRTAADCTWLARARAILELISVGD